MATDKEKLEHLINGGQLRISYLFNMRLDSDGFLEYVQKNTGFSNVKVRAVTFSKCDICDDSNNDEK